jgi:Protein of unknown function (DUF2785)
VSEYSRHSRLDLLEMLRSPDPLERDDIAYLGMVQRIGSGAEDDGLIALGDEIAGRLGDDEIQTRSFAALILGDIVERDQVTALATEEAVLRWRDAFAGWYATEKDLRGWDESLGWLHAVAHGADTLAAFGRSARLNRDDLRALLDIACARLLAPTDFVLRDQEDDRLGYALALVLSRPELDEDDSVRWLRPILAAFEAGGPGPVPANASNAMRTLRVLYLLCDRGFLLPEATQGETVLRTSVAHPAALMPALADVLRHAWPYLG